MKFAYFGYDFFLAAAERLLADGHDLLHVQTFQQDGQFLNCNEGVLALAQRVGVPAASGPASVEDMRALQAAGCEVIFVMGFQYKVPLVEGLRCVNLHPTLLPDGRGQFPLPWLILYHPEKSGLTLHRVTDELDSGPILAQVSVPVSVDERVESLCAKMQLAAVDFVATVAGDFDRYWDGAQEPVAEGTIWKAREQDWMLDWGAGWQHVMRTVRAFGALGSGALLQSGEWTVTDAVGWAEVHEHRPGDIVHAMPIGFVVAAIDGFVLLRNPVADG